MSKGGLAYEVILADPVVVPAPRRADSPEKTPSVEEIQEKLKAAEERRRVSVHTRYQDITTETRSQEMSKGVLAGL